MTEHFIQLIKPRVLVAEAHADDAAWFAGGAIALLGMQYVQVDSILFSDSNGRGVGNQRLREQKKMMKILRMNKLYPVGYENKFADGTLNETELFSPMVSALLHVLRQAEKENFPYTHIITFGQDGYSGHPDHIAVAEVVEYVFEMVNSLHELWQVGMFQEERALWPKNYFVQIPNMNFNNDYVGIDISQALSIKEEAIRSHTSQLPNGGIEHMQRIRQIEPVEYFKKTIK
ncbi:MAG: PIG-L family deacetylase [bacterium]|nr:PIG-L family deacetylase [bacterium]